MIRVLVSSVSQQQLPFCTAKRACVVLSCPSTGALVAQTGASGVYEWDQELQIPEEMWLRGCRVTVRDACAPGHLRSDLFSGLACPFAAHQRVCGVMIVRLVEGGGAPERPLQRGTEGLRAAALATWRHRALLARHQRLALELQRSTEEREADLRSHSECVNRLSGELQLCTEALRRLRRSRLLLFGKYVLL